MGETGADDPIQATDDGLREFAANEIVFVTKLGTNTDWVEEGVVETATKRYLDPGHAHRSPGRLASATRRARGAP